MGDTQGTAGLRRGPSRSAPAVVPPTKVPGTGTATLPGSTVPLSVAHAGLGNAVIARRLGQKGPAEAFKKEFENQFVPSVVRGRVEVAAPSLRRGKAVKPVTLLFDVPVEPVATFTLYAVPESDLFESEEAARLPPGEERDKQSLLVRGAPRLPDLTTPPADPGVTQSQNAPAPSRLHTSKGPVEVIARAKGFGITGEFHKLAVGAASTTVAKTPQGIIVIDAGAAGGASGPLAEATVVRLKEIIGGKPIVDLLSTHAHLDHTSLFKRIAGEFELLNLHINLAQAMAPALKFDELKSEMARAQRAFLEKQLRAEVESERTQWEAAHDVPEPAARETQWRQFVEERVATRLAARKVLNVDLQVPGAGGEMHVVSAPIEKIDVSKVEFAAGETVGVLQSESQSAIVNKDLARAIEKQKGSADEKAAFNVDRLSTSYVLIVDSKILALILPDLRVNDIKAIQVRLKAEMARLHRTAELRVWDIGHHLQAGFTGARASEGVTLPQARATQLLKLTKILHDFVSMKNALGKQPVDVVTVSAHDAFIDPATAWLFRSMGFEIVPALDGRDVRLVEAVTALGRNVAGLAGGQPLAAASPPDPLMRQSHAAVEELKQKVLTLKRQVVKLRKKADEPERERLRSEAARAREKIARIHEKTKDYVRKVAEQMTRSPGDPAPTAPGGQAEPAAEAQALRAELVGFERPVIGTLGTFSDLAVVLVGGKIPTDAREELRTLDEVRQLEAQVAAAGGNASPELRARYSAALENKRTVVRRRLAEADRLGPEAAEERKVLRDEIKQLDREVAAGLRASGASGEGRDVFKRRLPNGRLVETRIEVPKRASAFTRGVRTSADLFGRGMGAVMVYQLVRGETELEERYQRGEASLLEFGAGTVHNLYGLSIGVRMVGAVHVAPGEFVIMAALDITQTALREYDTTAQRNTAVAFSAIRAALSLGLMVAGQSLVETGHPLGILLGFGIVFLADPILEALGVYDWLEREFEFLPDDVVRVMQNLRKLLDEYRVIVGALEVAKRDDKQLKAVGAQDPAQTRRAAGEVVAAHRKEAKQKEADLLTAFIVGYEEAKKSYGGLPELDQYRAEFLKLMIQAQGEEAPRAKSEAELTEATVTVVKESMMGGGGGGLTSREKADAVFHIVEEGMTLEKMSSDQIAAMPQWAKMDEWMDKVGNELRGKETSDIDWKWLAEKVGELDQMFNSARYRLNPADAGAERATPLLPKGSPGRLFYERELARREHRFLYLRGSLTQASAGIKQPEGVGFFAGLQARLSPWGMASPTEPDVSITLDAALQSAEEVIQAYRKALDKQPALGDGLTAEGVGGHSWEAGTAYTRFVDTHPDYKNGLFRMKVLESAMRTSVGQAHAVAREAGTVVSTAQAERLERLPIEARKVIEERREEKSFLFSDEAKARLGEIRAKENLDLAALLGQGKDVTPLTGYEQEAAGTGALENLHLTTITNRLAKIEQLRFPTPEEVKQGKTNVEGIYKVVGDYGESDFFLFSLGGENLKESDNVLVGFVREAGDTTSGRYGHTTRIEVTPLNDSAVRLFGGTGNQTLVRNLLLPATIEDIRRAR